MLPVSLISVNPSTPDFQARLQNAKRAYTVRNINLASGIRLLHDAVPTAGDLVLARVERIGQHGKLELHSGRRSTLYVGDEILVTYGCRYAPDQYEAFVPENLGPCDLVASGGVASRAENKHRKMSQPTRIHPVGLIADSSGKPLNIAQSSLPQLPAQNRMPPVIVVVGTMMNAGKTTCAGNLIAGLKKAGYQVGAAKVTGTGSGNDRWFMTDAGADQVLDFTDMGHTSTFMLDSRVCENIFLQLTRHLAVGGAEVIVVEIADGLFQRETAALLEGDLLRQNAAGLVFAAADGLGALAGINRLRQQGHNVLALGGTITMSPLAMREATGLIDLPVATSEDLRELRGIPALDHILPRSAMRWPHRKPFNAGSLKWLLPDTRSIAATGA